MRARVVAVVFVAGLVAVGVATATLNDRWQTHATGDNEVPANTSQAQAQANFKLSDDGLSLSYKLNVGNIENVTQAHIHMAPAGANGAIVAWLYPSGPPAVLIPGRSGGTLGEGTITSASLTGPLAGQPLSALVSAINAGNAYVNVHTSQLPGGEVRGQIR
jgi:CHRD domain